MYGRETASLLACLSLVALPSPLFAQDVPDSDAHTDWAESCADWDDWDKPGPPFAVEIDIYYVGTCGIAAILVTSDWGHVLIDSGTENGAEIVATNIERLGFRLNDVKYLLQSHEHFDHIGGMAKLQELTGAQILASPKAAEVLISGEATSDDPQFGINEPMAPVGMVELVDFDFPIPLPEASVKPIATPGHTPGALSWQIEFCAGEYCRSVVYADSLTPISSDDYRFSDHPEYVQAYRDGLARLAELDCDILLTPHPSASGMRDKLLSGDLSSGPNCADYAASISARLDARLAQEMEATQ